MESTNIVSERDEERCSCSCAQELRALGAAIKQLKSEMEGRIHQQEQALGRALASLVPAVETLSAKIDKRQHACGVQTSASLPDAAEATRPSEVSFAPAVSATAAAPVAATALVAVAVPALHAAATSGDADALRRLLAAGGADPTVRDALGNSALHCAAAGGHVAALDALLEASASAAAERTALAANARGHKFRTPLHAAAKAGHADAACSLLAAGAQPDPGDAEGVTPLHLATWKGHRAVAALLLAEGAAVDAVNKDGLTPLDTAVLSGHAPLVQLLLEKGADLQRRDAQQSSLLHHAAAGGDRETVLLLLEKGLDVEAKNSAGLTALHVAASMGHVEVMDILIEKGADINAGIENEETPLMDAALGGHGKAVELLLARGAFIKESVTKSGAPTTINLQKTLLVAAAKGGSPVAVKALSISGASVTLAGLQFALERARNAEAVWALADVAPSHFRQAAEQALDTLVTRGSADALRAVLATGVDVSSERSVSALRLAAESNQADCVSALLDAGVWDEDQIALHTAVKQGNEKSVSLFLERGMTDKHKNEALTVAKSHFQFGIMRILVDAGADPFLVDSKDAWEFVKTYANQKMNKRITKIL